MKNNIKILSVIIAGLVGVNYASVKNVNVNDNAGLVVRNVLRQYASDNSGTVIDVADVTNANNLVSDVLAQINTPENDKVSIRFVAGLDSYSYDSAAFNITLKNSSGEIVKQEASYAVSSAYLGVEVNGEVKYASDIWGEGYNYLIAYTLNNVPTDYWNYQFDVTASVNTGGVSSTVNTKVIENMTDYNVRVNLFNVNGSKLGVKYEKVENNTIYTYTAPTFDGLVTSHDYVKGYLTNGEKDVLNIYYSEVDTWDGETVSTSLSGTGSEADPYLITSGADLAFLSNEVNNGNTFADKFVKMTKSINLVNAPNFMIGKSTTNSFAGTFDGNNCSIRDLNISRTASRTGLFFDLIGSGLVKNISTYGSFTGAQYTGSIVGSLQGNSSLLNCTNYGSVSIISGKNGVGGVAGGMDKSTSIDNCVNYGDVTAFDTTSHVGGITSVTWTSTAKILNSINFGNVTGGTQGTDGTYGTGGIVGTNKAALSNNKNYGNITSVNNNVSGIAGYSTNTVSNSDNYGVVSGTTYIGGIVGNTTKSIENSKNYGVVSGTTYIGGIAGKSTAAITSCVNNGLINGTERTGGIVGHLEGSISSCTNNGLVSGVTYTGGIAGTTATVTIEDSFNNGKVNVVGGNWTGGIVGCVTTGKTTTINNCANNGEVYNEKHNGIGGIVGGGIAASSVINISNCENKGSVYGNGKVGGIIGYYRTGTIENCVNNGEVSGKEDVHDLVGYNWSGTQEW